MIQSVSEKKGALGTAGSITYTYGRAARESQGGRLRRLGQGV